MAVKLNPRLSTAIALFRELGWAGASVTAAPELPLGTSEQRRVAVAGLASGQWGEIGPVGKNSWGYISAIDVNESMLALFAIRVGVDARRAAAIVPPVDDDVIAMIVAQRGPAFAERFIDGVCRPSNRMWEHSSSFHGPVAVRLVADLRLPVPQNLEYLKDWAVLAMEQAAIEHRDALDGREPPRDPTISWQFEEHLAAGAALGVPATGPFGRLIPLAVTDGWVGRDAAVQLAFRALDAAQRPGDRQRWAEIIVDDLAVSEAELAGRVDEIIPALSTGEPAVVERFAPRLIRAVNDDRLAEVALVSLMVKTRKAQRLVVAALTARGASAPSGADVVGSRLGELAQDKDRALARAAAALMQSWGVVVEDPVAVVGPPRGLWQPTPPLWSVPAFDPGALTPEALTECAAELLRGADAGSDIAVEQFLAVANAVARDDPQAARRALRGISQQVWKAGLLPVAAWVKSEPFTWGLDAHLAGHRLRCFPALMAREYAVFQRLGEVPCLLSQPSSVDLRIRVADLVERLRHYVAVGASATEADFLLALTRLDRSGADGIAPAELASLTVPVKLQSGNSMASHAGEVLNRYLSDPICDPGLVVRDRHNDWWCGDVAWPDSLAEFPQRIVSGYGLPTFAEVPAWGDAAMTGVRWTGGLSVRDIGIVARQLVRRGEPLPPGASINLLAIQRPVHPAAAEEVATAVVDAWQRGILRPGVADVRFLDWSVTPGSLAAFATALVDLAGEGLLSVVWPVLDDLLGASVRAPRLFAGTAAVAEAMAGLLPAVVASVGARVAPESALEVPGLRALALHPGSSQAVRVARAAATTLPAPAAPTHVAADESGRPSIALPDNEFQGKQFAEVWPVEAGSLAPLPDGVLVHVDWVDAKAPTRLLRFDLEAPGHPDTRFRVIKGGWHYDLEYEGQCQAVPFDHGAEPAESAPTAYLHWDAEGGRLAAAVYRDWRGGTDGPLTGGRTPLSDALVAVALGVATQDGDAGLAGRHLLAHLADKELIGAASVRSATTGLLTNEVFTPARLAALVESQPRLLPVLWPVLTEPIRVVGLSDGMPPRWLNRVLESALLLAPYLQVAAHLGRLPADAAVWQGLRQLAARSGPAGVVTKARRLVGALDLG